MTAIAARAATLPVELGVASRALPGETESGDGHLVASFRDGVLIAVADGLGHGPEAAAASRIAMEVLRERPDDAVTDLVRRCHAALHRTRGVVLSLASIDARAQRMTWVGVGNVEAALICNGPVGLRRREGMARRGGVVGYQLPPLRAATLPLAHGDMLVFATDGVSGEFHEALPLDLHPQDAAEHVVRHYGKATDDALVLIARYAGAPS